MMEVETRNASLDTLAVTIQALHVSGKQMTLAVFRQLPSASLLDGNCNKDGSLMWWGTVNYKIGDEGAQWVVCERAGRLYRAAFARRSDKYERQEIERIKAGKFIGRDSQGRMRNQRDLDRPEVAAALDGLMRDSINIGKNNRVIDEVDALPQLFIAV
jgi:hypothetical protein